MTIDDFKEDLDMVLGSAAVALSDEEFDELIEWLKTDTGWFTA